MAFGKINNTAEVAGQSFKRYMGVLPVEIIAVNPNKKELGEIYGKEPENEPSYTGEVEYEHPVTKQKSTVKTARIDFIVKNEELEFLSKVSFFLRDTPFVSQAGKCKVIDKFGRTAWVTPDQFKAKEIPVYRNNMPARIEPDYNVSYRNEEELIKFIKFYLGIPDVDRYVDGQWVKRENAEECIVALEKISDYFNGDFSELKEVVSIAKNNRVKILAGVKIQDGNTYQDVYIGDFVRNSSNDFNKLFRSLQSSQANGAYPNSIFYRNNVVTEAVVWEGVDTAKSTAGEYNPFAQTDTSIPSSPSADAPSDLPF